jgi:hypothetical protein
MRSDVDAPPSRLGALLDAIFFSENRYSLRRYMRIVPASLA